MFVANSDHVAERIKRYYGRSAEVVHPPVDVEHFLGLRARAAGDYYLVFGRVVPYKRVDLAVAACARLGRRLKVAGDGRALEAVRAQARARAREFLGKVSEARARPAAGRRAGAAVPGRGGLRDRARRGAGGGLPVIAYGVGGAVESVLDGRTGVLFAEQTVDGLAAAIERFEGLRLDRAGRARERARASAASASARRWRR